MAFAAQILRYLDDRSGWQSQGRPRTDATLSHHNHDGHLRATRTQQSAPGGCKDDGYGGVPAFADRNHQLSIGT